MHSCESSFELAATISGTEVQDEGKIFYEDIEVTELIYESTLATYNEKKEIETRKVKCDLFYGLDDAAKFQLSQNIIDALGLDDLAQEIYEANH